LNPRGFHDPGAVFPGWRRRVRATPRRLQRRRPAGRAYPWRGVDAGRGDSPRPPAPPARRGFGPARRHWRQYPPPQQPRAVRTSAAITVAAVDVRRDRRALSTCGFGGLHEHCGDCVGGQFSGSPAVQTVEQRPRPLAGGSTRGARGLYTPPLLGGRHCDGTSPGPQHR
jgi:hypothetical protein